MPLQLLIEYIDRRTHELTDAIIHDVKADDRTKRLYLHIETKTDENGHMLPFDFDLDWNEIFGVIPCEVSGEAYPVEEITVSRAAAQKMRERIEELEKRVLELGGVL